MLNLLCGQITALIPLLNRKGNLRDYAIVDEEDYDKVSKYSWHYSRGYARGYVNGEHILMHKFILDKPFNLGLLTDHIDRNKLNNSRKNIRDVTDQQNKQNKVKQKGEYTSPYIGVHWSKDHRKWKALIMFKGKGIHLGYYDDMEEANEARIRGEEKYYTHFVRVK